MPTKDKKSPIKAKPLRNPGQSIQEQLYDLLFDKFLLPWTIVILLVALAAMEWTRYFYP